MSKDLDTAYIQIGIALQAVDRAQQHLTDYPDERTALLGLYDQLEVLRFAVSSMRGTD